MNSKQKGGVRSLRSDGALHSKTASIRLSRPFYSLLDNVLNLLSLSYFAIGIAKGLLILMAALLDSLGHRWSTS